MSHLTRAMRLLNMLRRLRIRAYTTEELADIYGLSTRTIRADLQELSGYPEYAPLICKVCWSVEDMGLGPVARSTSEGNLQESCR